MRVSSQASFDLASGFLRVSCALELGLASGNAAVT